METLWDKFLEFKKQNQEILTKIFHWYKSNDETILCKLQDHILCDCDSRWINLNAKAILKISQLIRPLKNSLKQNPDNQDIYNQLLEQYSSFIYEGNKLFETNEDKKSK